MTSQDSWLAYKDCFDLFDAALEDPDGVRVAFDTEGRAAHFRARMHYARVLDRRKNREIYPEDNKMYGMSEYDKFQCRIVFGGKHEGKFVWWLYVENKTIENMRIEPLSKVVEEDLAEPPPMEEEKAPPTQYEPIRRRF